MSETDMRIDAAFLASLLPQARAATGIPVGLARQSLPGLKAQNLTRTEFKLCVEGDCFRKKLRVCLDRLTADGSLQLQALSSLILAITKLWDPENSATEESVYIQY